MEEHQTPGAPDGDTRIQELRSRIDAIDEQIVSLLNQRMECAIAVGKIKEATGARVQDRARETHLIRRLIRLSQGPLRPNALYQIYTEIMAASREIQKPQVIAYLGPEATYTHIAAMKYFGHSHTFVPQTNIYEVFHQVEKRTFHYGVVPVENSIEGAVNHTLDLFFESDLKICAEQYQPISHDLLSQSGILKEIRTVYSHPQAFAQCQGWIRKHLPEAELAECSSTAHAAQKASRDPAAAAISSREAAHIYNLQVVASKIEDFARNITRFLVIGTDEIDRTGDDKTSLMFATPHTPGALYSVLQPIAEAGINMVKLESRPTKHENWSYFFFADLEGHIEDPLVRDTVARMKTICQFLKWLGSYPRARENDR